MKKEPKFILFLFLIILVGCKQRLKERDYYDETNYKVKDSLFYKDHTPENIILINRYDTSWILLKLFWPNGVLYAKSFLHNRRLEGPFIFYFPGESKVATKGTNYNGRWNGQITTFYKNGKVNKIMYFKVGKAIGIWKAFDSTGHLIDSTVHQ